MRFVDLERGRIHSHKESRKVTKEEKRREKKREKNLPRITRMARIDRESSTDSCVKLFESGVRGRNAKV